MSNSSAEGEDMNKWLKNFTWNVSLRVCNISHNTEANCIWSSILSGILKEKHLIKKNTSLYAKLEITK